MRRLHVGLNRHRPTVTAVCQAYLVVLLAVPALLVLRPHGITRGHRTSNRQQLFYGCDDVENCATLVHIDDWHQDDPDTCQTHQWPMTVPVTKSGSRT